MRIILALLLLATTSAAFAETVTIRIRFANGRTGKPLRLKSYERGASPLPEGAYQVQKIENESLLVTFTGVSEFSFRSDQFDPCDVRDKQERPPQYNLDTILQQGIVAPNFCGRASSVPKAGELLIYSRHQHWWKITGNIARGLLICA